MSPAATATVTLLSFLHLLALAHSSSLDYVEFACDTPTYAPKGSYAANLDALLSDLPTRLATAPSGFANSSVVGSGNSSSVYGLALCRGDIDAGDCLPCLSQAIDVLRLNCSRRMEAVVWLELCMVRYAGRDVFSDMEGTPSVIMHNVYPADRGDAWKQVLGATINAITDSAAAGGGSPGKKFAMKAATYTSLLTLYTMAQCTPDLTSEECMACLEKAAGSIFSYEYIGCIVLLPSCTLRYEQYSFSSNFTLPDAVQEAPPPPPPPSPPLATSGSVGGGKCKGSTNGIVIAAAAAAVEAAIFLVLLIGMRLCLVRRRRIKKAAASPAGLDIDMTTIESLQFEFKTLLSATQSFSAKNRTR